MKTLILTSTAIAFAFTLSAAAHAGASAVADGFNSIAAMSDGAAVDKRRKPRIKGGSGCDSMHDILEHPECR
jgi:hypothetical protein